MTRFLASLPHGGIPSYSFALSRHDSVYTDPESSGQDEAGEMVHEPRRRRETEAHRGGPRVRHGQRRETHQLCRGSGIKNFLMFYWFFALSFPPTSSSPRS